MEAYNGFATVPFPASARPTVSRPAFIAALPQFLFQRRQDEDEDSKEQEDALPQFLFQRRQDGVDRLEGGVNALPQFLFQRRQDIRASNSNA